MLGGRPLPVRSVGRFPWGLDSRFIPIQARLLGHGASTPSLPISCNGKPVGLGPHATALVRSGPPLAETPPIGTGSVLSLSGALIVSVIASGSPCSRSRDFKQPNAPI